MQLCIKKLQLRGRIRAMTPFTRGLVFIALVNFTLRIVWISQSASVTTDGPTDQASYVYLGQKLAHLRRYTSFYTTPIYPIFIAGVTISNRAVIKIFRVELPLRATAGFCQAVIGVGMIVLVALLTRRMVMVRSSERVADWAGLITAAWLAVWVNQILSTSVLLTERVATPLFIASIACLLWQRHLTRWRLFGSGILFAATMLTRPALGVGVGVALVLILVRTSGWKMRGRNLALFVIGLLVLFVPWWGYTASQAGGPLWTLSSSGSFNTCMGNNDDADGRWSEKAIAVHCPYPRGATDAATDNAALTAKSWGWMSTHLNQQPHLIKLRTIQVFHWDRDSLDWFPDYNGYHGPGSFTSLAAWCQAWWRIVLWLTPLGIIALVYRLRRASLWVIGFGTSTLVAPLMSVGDARYHEVMVVLSCVGLGCLFSTVLDWIVLGVEKIRGG